MGLDVYLYSQGREDASNAYDAAWDAWYEKYQEIPDNNAEKKAARAALPSGTGSDDGEKTSSRYPDHLFNRRYLRSSYNSGGFNSAVPDIVGAEHSLYWIFEPVLGGSDEYSFELTEGSLAALAEARDRALQVAEEIRAAVPLRAEAASCFLGDKEHMWQEPPTGEEVLAWYRDEATRRERQLAKNPHRPSPFGDDAGYSNAKGHVFGFKEGLEVMAITSGRDVMGGPAAIFVYKMGDEAKESYAQSAEITAEFCEEAIALIERDGAAFLHWSA